MWGGAPATPIQSFNFYYLSSENHWSVSVPPLRQRQAARGQQDRPLQAAGGPEIRDRGRSPLLGSDGRRHGDEAVLHVRHGHDGLRLRQEDRLAPGRRGGPLRVRRVLGQGMRR